MGHRCSMVSMPPGTTQDLLAQRLGDVDLAALRRGLATRRAQHMSDRGQLVRRALHRVAWGDDCVAALPSPAEAAAITDQQIIAHARGAMELIRAGTHPGQCPDTLPWRGGLYYGSRNQARLAVGIQLPWPAGEMGTESALITATYLGRVGAPGTLVQALARRQVPYYAAAVLPLEEHGTPCLTLGLSTVADHVVALVETVRHELRRMRDSGVPSRRLPYLRDSAKLYAAIHPSDDLFQHRTTGTPGPPAGSPAPAVAVIGQLPDTTLTQLREAVREW
ncbi:hypothetical protein K4G22_02600 [Streptomyces profundus]|nr:hypothetical protein K4G22_02600 [Streptomyces sp. MA3_2.13]